MKAITSNSEWIDNLSDVELVKDIRIAMDEGCIRPAHVFDLIDELIQRFCEYQDICLEKENVE